MTPIVKTASGSPPADFIAYLSQNPAMAWVLIALLSLITLTLLYKFIRSGSSSVSPSLGLKRWLKGREIKAKILGNEISVSADATPDTPPPIIGPTPCSPPSPDNSSSLASPIPESFYEAVLDYGDYREELRDEEDRKIEAIIHRAREITRTYKDDFIAQMKLLNHELYSKTRGSMSDGRDHHFNTICRGELQVLLPKELLDIFDKNHFYLMDATQYKEEMETHFHRIKRLVYAAFGADWYHPDYSLVQFQSAMEDNIDRGLRGHMNLMLKYRQLSNQRLAAKERTRTLCREARDHIRKYGSLPEGCRSE